MKKLKLSVVALATLMTLPFTSVQAQEISSKQSVEKRIELSKEENLNFTEKQEINEIQKKMAQISDKYKIGEALSDDDAKFIRENSNIQFNNNSNLKGVVNTLSVDKKFFEGYKNNGVIDGALVGFAEVDKGWLNHSIRVYMTTYDRKGISRPLITQKATFTGYGFVGSDGVIGKVVDFTLKPYSDGRNVSEHTMDQTQSFSGVLAYGYLAPQGQIYYTSNNESDSVTISKVEKWEL
ncbi:hypothetical protein IIU_06513 [Bacillus cereus VD133]|uniref:Uncharacterized protein n=1 Tax=Bacillus cereus VD133 TaxID=1053233 RepID=A0A9W5PK62_BACCE|nr:hypothetical protein [Bacillus cereus]EOO24940.1 hypothetical protein IIU_06513 [Bacillus cereus VD133]